MNPTPIVKRDLTLAYVVSLPVALLMTVASIAGLLYGTTLYAGLDRRYLPLFVGQDLLNLVVGLPLLLGSMWLARRGSLIGLLLWPGALFYVLYDYGYYVLGAPFGVLFIPFIALVTLSGYAMIAVISSIDAEAVRARVAPAVPNRSTGGFLVGLAVLFTVLWTAMSISMLTSGVVDEIARIVTIMDLTIQLPALFVGGILLWRGKAFGYVVTAGLLLQAAAYLMGLSTITFLQEQLMGTPFDAVAVLPGFVVGGISLALLGTFVRGAAVETGHAIERAVPAVSGAR